MDPETIAAIATAPGEAAIAIIRISGSESLKIAEAIFSKNPQHFKSHTVHYGKILAKDLSPIDDVLLLVMRAPNSYTGEDSIEIFCHGGPLVTKKVLQRVLDAGARAAKPGEFSLRAFLNQKIDLAQAEAVQELIAAKSEMALENAEKQLQGTLSKQIRSLQQELTEMAAILEAWVDFPEEGLEFASEDEILLQLKAFLEKLETLKNTFDDGKVLHEGFTLCLLGSVNVGKSSLMNALLKKDRAIVTPVPGTTRDLLEEDLILGSLHFKLIDTAGVRNTEEPIEKEGILRAQRAVQEADLILLLLDASRPLSDEDLELLKWAPEAKRLLVWNKVDLKTPPDTMEAVHISAKEGLGLEDLKNSIQKLLWKQKSLSKEEVLITKMRHYEALCRASESIQSVLNGFQSQVSAEFICSDMRQALGSLANILGTDVTEDILSAIFSKFCLGK